MNATDRRPSGGNDGNGHKVLVIGGGGDSAPDLEKGLERLGYRMTARAITEEEAIIGARESRPDILIVDIIPRDSMDGVRLAERMFREFGLPVVLVSSVSDEGMVRHARLAGPFGHVTEPLDDRRLLSAIEMAVFKHAAGKALRQSEKRYRELVDNLSEVVVEIDMDGNISYVSRQSTSIFGFTPEEICGKNFADFVHPDFLAGALDALSKIPSGGQHFDFEFKTLHKDGHYVYASVSGRVVQEENDTKIVGILKDVTERKRAEEALKESEEKYRSLVDNTGAGVAITDIEGRFTLVNKALCRMVGYSGSELMGQPFADFLHPEDIGRLLQLFRGSFEDPGSELHLEFRAIRKDGSVVHCYSSPTISRRDGEITGFNAIIYDITEHKRAEEALKSSEERFRLLAENAKDMIYRVRLKPEGAVEYISPSAHAFTGYTPEEFYADTGIGFDLVSPGEGGGMRNIVMTRENLDKPVTMRWKRNDGGLIWAELVNHPVLNASGEVVTIEGVARDITERKDAEEQVIASLKEKEVLLKEIHHRVKNNLQIIQSLLNMQFRRVKDMRVLNVLRESQNRVRSMALIHERLYRSTNLSQVDLRAYITKLVSELYTSYGADPERIRLYTQLEDVRLEIDDAIPCGLIINELVSNALKHGFPRRRRGMLQIRLGTGPHGNVILVVRDNGVGLRRGMDFRRTKTLGLQLVCTLVDQLSGKIEARHGKGTEFRISFKPGMARAG